MTINKYTKTHDSGHVWVCWTMTTWNYDNHETIRITMTTMKQVLQLDLSVMTRVTCVMAAADYCHCHRAYHQWQ